MPVKKTTQTIQGTYELYCEFTEDKIPTQVDWEQTFVCLNHKIVKIDGLKFTFTVWPHRDVTTKSYRYDGDSIVTYTQHVYLEFDCECPSGTTRQDFPCTGDSDFKDEIQKHLIGWNVIQIALGELS